MAGAERQMPRGAGSQNVRIDVLDAEGGRKPEGQGWPESIPAASTNKQPPPLCGGGFLLAGAERRLPRGAGSAEPRRGETTRECSDGAPN